MPSTKEPWGNSSEKARELTAEYFGADEVRKIITSDLLEIYTIRSVNNTPVVVSVYDEKEARILRKNKQHIKVYSFREVEYS
jgi:hypothetical protein